MSRSLNKAMLIGHVGSDPDIRTTTSGTMVAKLSLATDDYAGKNRRGEPQEKTNWHRVTAFGKLAEVVEKWVAKGDRLYVEGRIEYSTTDGDDGHTRYWTDVIARELIMLGGSEVKAKDSYEPPATRGTGMDPEQDQPDPEAGFPF